MRLILVSIGLFVLFLTHLTGQPDWEVIHEALILNGDLHFISEDTALISDGKRIFKTCDGGKNWSLVRSGLEFESIFFYSDYNGWAIAQEETTTECNRLYKTQDGGQHWKKQDFCVKDLDELIAITDSVIYLRSSQKIFKTSNGGQNWKEITPFPDILHFGGICFFNRDTGLVIGERVQNRGLLFRTFNGGNTWDNIPMEFGCEPKPVLVDNSTVYFVGSTSSIYNGIFKTTDMFETWSPISDTLNAIMSFHFFNDDTVIALYNAGSGGEKIIKSTDGGVTWKETDHMDLSSDGWGAGGYLFAVNETAYYFSSGGNMSFLLKSEDFGDRWSSLYVGSGFNDIHFLDSNTGFATVGYSGWHLYGGLLLKTLDGGKTLQIIKSTSSMLEGIHFFNRSNGVIIGVQVGSLYTHNGGETWMLDEKLRILDYYSMNGCYGWMMGIRSEDQEFEDSVLVMKTIDGGHTWDTTHRICRVFNDIEEDNALHFASLYYITEKKGFIVGEGGLILSLSGQGDCERIESGTTLPLYKIMFVNEEIGFISGGYFGWGSEFHPMLMKTNNGGETWIQIPGMNYYFKDFWMEDEHHGWAIGTNQVEAGAQLETIDGGEHWIKADSSLPVGLNAFHFSNGALWAVGENTVILKYMLSDTSANGEPDTCTTSDVMWDPTFTSATLQNYPNPFASTTTIRYSVPIFGPVEICVYDMSGRKVLTLHSKKQKEGLYEIVWNAEDLQPGIYFCELRIIQARHISKMVIMR